MNYERIVLWVLIVVILLRLFVVQERYTASNPMSIMDLAEFHGFPDDVKQIWQTNIVNTIIPAVNTKMAEVWNTVSDADKQTLNTQVNAAATQLATNIRNASLISAA